jgi:hypothetical protein
MRPTALLAGPVLVLVLGTPGSAQTPPAAPAPAPDIRYVLAPEAEVRCGPSTKPEIYPTNRLRHGDRVQVVAEGAGGWLAIRPPESSFSWINTRFLQNIVPHQPNYVVAQEGVAVPVIIGSSIKRDRPDVVGARLQRGAQVRSVGPALADGEGTWMPVEPPPAEVRYIRAEAVAKTLTPPDGPGPTAVTVASPVGGVVPAASPAAPPAPPPPPDGDALWRQAQDAERRGQVTEAIRLYEQAGRANVSVNPARSAEAFERARWLGTANQGTGIPTNPLSPPRDPRQGLPPGEARMTGTGDHVYPVPTDPGTLTVRLASPGPPAPAPAQPGASCGPGGSCSAGSGRLRRAGRTVEDQRTYVLENSQGFPLFYVTPRPGIDLEPYLQRDVELFGPVIYRGDLRANFMTVTGVRPVQ